LSSAEMLCLASSNCPKEGQNALRSLTSGGYDTAIGFLSLFSDTQGSFNTAIGAGTLLANTGYDNTATGGAALLNNTTGSYIRLLVLRRSKTTRPGLLTTASGAARYSATRRAPKIMPMATLLSIIMSTALPTPQLVINRTACATKRSTSCC
jgi:2-keto-3-deoxy-6-phosphogluconate aldolase